MMKTVEQADSCLNNLDVKDQFTGRDIVRNMLETRALSKSPNKVHSVAQYQKDHLLAKQAHREVENNSLFKKNYDEV